jgi:UDP-N-acetylmuramyl pentapeptide synthase
LLFTFGSEAGYIADGALSSKFSAELIRRYDDLNNPEALASALKATAKAGDVILFKASRAVALERVIALLK